MSFDSDFSPEIYGGDIMNYTGEVGSSQSLQILISDEVSTGEKGYAHGPERALMLAMLFDAIQGYICYAQLPASKKLKSSYREAFNWVHAKTKDYVFSFNNVCEAIGMNPAYLRLGLINIGNSQVQHKRARRKF